MTHHPEDIRYAAEVARFMYEMHKADPARYRAALAHGLPHGDLAYGAALRDWEARGRPAGSWFSYASGQRECALLLSFREEIAGRFGLEILPCDEGQARRALVAFQTVEVTDWEIN